MTAADEPIERHMARIEAAGRLVSDLPGCIHCHRGVELLATTGELPRAVGIVHERGCPIEVEFENAPAAEYSADDDGLVQ